MTDIARARIELMRIARSLTFVDPCTSRRIEIVIEDYLAEPDEDHATFDDVARHEEEAGAD